ncbi:MAG TPA: di-heme-cytochrome C peroxidase [Cellvibrio sp.]|nr:di-heme-cytochrome C peroxidase [Cellvibrio sp.]
MKIKPVFAGILVCAAALAGCSSFWPDKAIRSSPIDIPMTTEVGEAPQRMMLDQNWNDKTRMDFWFTSQGARILPYTWFVWLEEKDKQTLFRSVEHMESLRYLPMPESAMNPGGLPVGFTMEVDKKSRTAWMGLNCAACHTNQIDYGDKKILVDGAPTLANFVGFFSELVAALNQTYEDDAKFERFARNVLQNDYSKNNAATLRKQLSEISFALSERENVNRLPASYPKDFTSYARLDAFTNIQNAGTAFALGDVTNRNPPIAPVSYPFLWGTHQSDVVQWNASAPNTPVVGPLIRNIGEVVGVFGHLQIKKAPWWQRLFGHNFHYRSTVDMMNLGYLESWVKDLRSPQWQDTPLPPVNVSQAVKGEVLFKTHCTQCHQVIPRQNEGDKYTSIKTPLSEIGTDPDMAWYADNHVAKTLILEGTKEGVIFGPPFGPEAPAIQIPVNGVVGLVLHDPMTALKAGLIPEGGGKEIHITDAEIQTVKGYVKQHLEEREKITKDNTDVPRSGVVANADKDLGGLVYKARPLNGIWATAPYLHNGSVPNLWELLQKPEKRVTRFWVGSRKFDPVNVGFVTTEGLDEFQVLNSAGAIQPGNSNRGHEAGTNLSDNEKRQLIEYMKML